MGIAEASWRLAAIDGLFLLLAGGLFFWFRTWLARQNTAFERRLEALEGQQAVLERLSRRLTQVLEAQQGPSVGGARTRAVRRPDNRTRTSEEALYTQARALLARGSAPEEVARRLDMGISEVEVLRRVLRYETGN